MKRFLTTALVLLLVVGTVAMATPTRVLTLGETGDVLKDEANVQVWPQAINWFPNRLFGNVTGAAISDVVWFYQNAPVENLSLGLWFSTTGWADPYLPAYFGGDLDQKLNLLLGTNVGEMPVGLGLSIYGNSHEMKGTNKTAHNGLGLRIDLGATLMEQLDAGFFFSTFSWEEKDAAGNTVAENEGGTNLGINVRYWYEFSETYTLIPHLSFGTFSTGRKPAAGASTKDDATNIVIGVGNNIAASDKVLLVSDIGLRLWSRTVDAAGSKTDTTHNYFPYFKGGAECFLSDKFTFRFGYAREWNQENVKQPNGDEEATGWVTSRFYLGAAYTRGPLSVDFNLDPGFFTRGPYFISGSGGNIASQISIRWIWGE